MSDRDLLEMAAKAAGAKWTDYSDRTPDHWIIEHADRVWREWSPLTDDGDALWLAVKLRMVLIFEDSRIGIGPDINGPEVHPDEGEDYAELARRAIVEYAAAIGSSMP